MALNYKKLKEWQHLEPLQKQPVTKVQLVKYAGASGDFNPLHTDDEFGKKMGLTGVIAHGMLIMGFLGQYVADLAGNAAEINNFKMRFGDMTTPGDAIVCSGTVAKLYEEGGKSYAKLDLKAEVAPTKMWSWSNEKKDLELDYLPNKTVGSGEVILRFR